ncbi:hypothetical protein E2C01_055292 [Portunus trituberculatus]|uniref:Uncharacterized protein n=1 Tax=Portunus trituberculatus TaxID=210409 RepID=A0A5B7GUF4_PORTR|nr:hypothetical protein [Portunus trituberculatus]
MICRVLTGAFLVDNHHFTSQPLTLSIAVYLPHVPAARRSLPGDARASSTIEIAAVTQVYRRASACSALSLRARGCL